jgi:hypothetical protein
MLARRCSNRTSRSSLDGMQDATATLGDILAVSYKTKHTPTIQHSSSAPWYLLK